MDPTELSCLLHRHDPQGIAEGGPDEYDGEADSILEKIEALDAVNEEAVLSVVHTVFLVRFGRSLAGGREAYRAIVRDICRAL